jgi:hypothetical protein
MRARTSASQARGSMSFSFAVYAARRTMPNGFGMAYGCRGAVGCRVAVGSVPFGIVWLLRASLTCLIQRIAAIRKPQLYNALNPRIDPVSRPPPPLDRREFRYVRTVSPQKPPAVRLLCHTRTGCVYITSYRTASEPRHG